MIGKICKARTPFYDLKTHQMSYKARPALVLAKADAEDYVILPVSSISIQSNIDPVYDIKIDPALYPNLNLKNISYVRTHKQTIIHRANLHGEIGDLKAEYNELYCKILKKRDAFSKTITQQAL